MRMIVYADKYDNKMNDLICCIQMPNSPDLFRSFIFLTCSPLISPACPEVLLEAKNFEPTRVDLSNLVDSVHGIVKTWLGPQCKKDGLLSYHVCFLPLQSMVLVKKGLLLPLRFMFVPSCTFLSPPAIHVLIRVFHI